MSPHLLRPQIVSRGIRGVTKNILVSRGQAGDPDRGNGKQKGLLTCQRTKNHFPKRGKHETKELTTNQPNTLLLRTNSSLPDPQDHANNGTPSLVPTHNNRRPPAGTVRLSAPSLYSHQVSSGALNFLIARVAIRKGGKGHTPGERTQ